MVTLSTAEAECLYLAFAFCQVLWLKMVLRELKHPRQKGILIFCNNNSAISICKNLVFHGKNKHIRIKYQFLIDLLKDGIYYFKSHTIKINFEFNNYSLVFSFVKTTLFMIVFRVVFIPYKIQLLCLFFNYVI